MGGRPSSSLLSREEATLTGSKSASPLRVVGLTGGVAAGKSTVASILRELGAHVLDADQLGREVVRPGEPALAELVREFGIDCLGPAGELNRRLLGERAFERQSSLARLNRIVHPRIHLLLEERLRALRRKPPRSGIVVVEAAVLLEAGWDRETDVVVAVVTQQRTRVARLIGERGLDAGSARRLIRLQMRDSDRIRRADFVVHGDDLAQTQRQVAGLWERLMKPAPDGRGSADRRRTRIGVAGCEPGNTQR